MAIHPNQPESLEKKTFIIVGAGPAGLFSARALEKSGVPRKNITILGKEPWVGGKCHTYTDEVNAELATEYGAALVAHNYRMVLDAIFDKKIPLEVVLHSKSDSMDFVKQYHKKGMLDKALFAGEFAKELVIYEQVIREYEYIRDNKLTLPVAYELPFAEFAKLKGLTKLTDLLRPLVTGFGYGAMQVCPAFAVLEYMGHTTIHGMGMIPALLKQGPFYAIQGGFQRLMEAIAADYQVLTNVEIKSIERSNGICVDFNDNQQIKADYLILALSPLHWQKLGLNQLTDTEKAVQQKLTYYRYPVAICKLKGYPPQQEFFETGLQPEGFGKLSLITTRDNRPNPTDGRLCTAYVNLPQGAVPYKLSPHSAEYEQLKNELASLPGVEEVNILDTKIWEDYMSMLPWSLRCQLEAEQFSASTNTGYVNSCLSFEDVCCVAEYATKLIAETFTKQPIKVYDNSLGTDLSRMYRLFWSTPQNKPVSIDTTIYTNKKEPLEHSASGLLNHH